MVPYVTVLLGGGGVEDPALVSALLDLDVWIVIRPGVTLDRTNLLSWELVAVVGVGVVPPALVRAYRPPA